MGWNTSQTSSSTTVTKQLPINRFSSLDSVPIRVAMLSAASAQELMTATGISRETANRVAAFVKKRPLHSIYELLQVEGLSHEEVERIRRCSLFAEDTRIAITDVAPVQDGIFSNRPFAIRVRFVSVHSAAPVLVSIQVRWVGKPFTVEKKVTVRDTKNGYIDVAFGKEQRLPTGPAAFDIALFNAAGAQARFRTTCYVLPSNPFSLNLSPNINFVTGTFSARGVRSGNNYVTAINVTLSNGNGADVPMSSQFT